MTTETHQQLDRKVASLFCEPSETFKTAEGTTSDHIIHYEDLRRSTPSTFRRRGTRGKRNTDSTDNSPGPYTEPSPQFASPDTGSSPGDAKLTPWTPPANSWPPKESDGCTGVGPYYANAVGCMGPGRERDVEAVAEANGEVGGY